MFPLIIVGVAIMAQPQAPAEDRFSIAEIRTMCRGETDEPAEFRTEAAYRLLANFQHAKCRMYLLGIADGIGRYTRRPRACTRQSPDRETMADRLVAAVLREGDSSQSISSLVERVLATEARCPEGH